jgi:hypothetical protein
MKNATVQDEIDFIKRDLDRTYLFMVGDMKKRIAGHEIVKRLSKYNPSAAAHEVAKMEFGGPEEDIEFVEKRPVPREKRPESDPWPQVVPDMELVRKTRRLQQKTPQ